MLYYRLNEINVNTAPHQIIQTFKGCAIIKPTIFVCVAGGFGKWALVERKPF